MVFNLTLEMRNVFNMSEVFRSRRFRFGGVFRSAMVTIRTVAGTSVGISGCKIVGVIVRTRASTRAMWVGRVTRGHPDSLRCEK